MGAIAVADLLSASCALTRGQLLMRVDVARAVSGFSTHCVPSDDWDLQVSLASRGTLWGVAGAVLQYRLHANNTSKKTAHMRRAGLALRLGWLRRLPWQLKWEVVKAYACRAVDRGVVRPLTGGSAKPPGPPTGGVPHGA